MVIQSETERIGYQGASVPSMVPTPWLQESAVYFLLGWLSSRVNPRILEFGSGKSTIWFGAHGWTTLSIEHDKSWFDKVRSQAGTCVDIRLLPRPYSSVCKTLQRESFDMILVDGRDRVCCIRESLPLLRSGGVIMLDNSEREYYHKGTDLMSSWHMVTAIGQWKTSWWIKPEQTEQRT